MGLLVVPCLVGVARFHGRKNMNEPRVVASYVKNLLDAFFFSEIFLADELDLKTIFRSKPLSILSELISKGLCKTWIIKDADMVVAQKAGHPLSMAQCGHSSLDHHTIKTAENSKDLVSITLREKYHIYLSSSSDFSPTHGVDIEQ